MANLQFEPSSAQLSTVQEIQFGLLSPEDIKSMSVVHVEYPETMDDTRGKPREKGLNDPKLGSTERFLACGTCGEVGNVCPGHFGHIELAVPVFHIGFLAKIKKLLESVCHNCGKLLEDEHNAAFRDALRIRDPKRRFDAVHKLCKPRLVCETNPAEDADPQEIKNSRMHGGCGNQLPEIRKDGLRLMGTWKVKKSDEEEEGRQPEKRQITPQMALDIFRNISTEDVRKLGLSNDYARPEWLLITVLPVPPPHVRPSVVVQGNDSGPRGEDDLTYKLGDIVRANGNVRRCETEGSPAHVKNEFENLLQFHVATYMDNNIAGQPQALQKSGRPVKSIRARLKGKEGRLRGNLMGKRVDFSARTVITGDPNLSLDEVGVPESIARELTYPETVTPRNIQRLQEAIEKGPNISGGANYVMSADGSRKWQLSKSKNTPQLAWGWKVERHLRTGDYVIFNRQPSLHKESMMGHRVRVMPYSTFRLNLSVTTPYNADFDGDEMNLHVPQTEETRAEIQNICMVPLNIVSPQRNGPLMGIIQDTLCGIYKICRRDVLLSQSQVMNMLMWVPDWDGTFPQPAIIKPRPRWTGKQIISMALPTGFNLVRKGEEGMCPIGDDGLLVQNGELIFGLFNKKSVGSSGGGVIHVIYNDKGPRACVDFFNGAQRIINYWLLQNGFSIGIGDTIPDQATIDGINNAVQEEKLNVEEFTRQATVNQLEALPGMNIRETFESKVLKALNTARDNAGSRIEKSIKDINNCLQMAKSGSKGTTINISQITGVVGQQALEGKRIPFGFKYRTLPHFTKDDYSPESRGFVENSYLQGLTPTEFFFHAMSGREGLIDTAVKTAETGYIQRRLVKALEDVMVKYDGTVRNSLGDIAQFVYGEDGLDAIHIESQRIDIVTCSNAQFDNMFKVDVMSSTAPLANDIHMANDLSGDSQVQALFDDEYDALKRDRDFLREGRSDNESFYLPLNIQRMIETAKTTFRLKDDQLSDLDPSYAIPQVKSLLERLVIVRGDDPLSREAQDSATILFKALVRSRLAYKRIVHEFKLNKLAFDNILGDIESRFTRAAVSPGEMVGVLAAQSIGEPATQMTLNTFHFAGVSSKNVTLGVPRLKEILNVAANIKTPSMTVYQLPQTAGDSETCQSLRGQVEHTSLRSVTESTEIYYDPSVQTTIIPADADMVESFFLIPEDNADDPSQQSRWLLRIRLDYARLKDKDLNARIVAMRIKEAYGRDLAVIFSDDNADHPIVRVRLNTSSFDNQKDDDGDANLFHDQLLRRIEEHMLDSLTLRGIPGIERAFLNSKTVVRENADGALIAKKTDPLCSEWFLDTSGTSLAKVLEIPDVDGTRTYSNSFIEIFQVFGIEATRAALLRELTQVLAFDGSYVNHRHLALLVDVMTARGHLMAVTRHGINRADTGALARCSFEETVEILLEAAASGELDDCRGVTENIILGQLAPAGTGEMEVLIDHPMLNEHVKADNAETMGWASAGVIEEGGATPYEVGSPMGDSGYASPDYGGLAFSPLVQNVGADSGGGFSSYDSVGETGGFSPSPWGPTSPAGAFGGTSPGYATSPRHPGSASPMYAPTSPMGFAPSSPSGGLASPAYGAASPSFASPSSPAYSPTSPSFSPASPAYGAGASPSSPSYSPASPSYSPTSPSYSPTSPAHRSQGYSPASPSYSPTSPKYSPNSSEGTRQSPTSPAYSPTSPQYSPASPNYSPTSPRFSPTSPTSPKYSPSSPAGNYSPTSPRYRPSGSPGPNGSTSPRYSPASPAYSPASPSYSPSSPRQ